MEGDILAMFDTVDLLVTDISSVGLDYLYLHPEKPLVLTDRRDDAAKLNDEAPISRATPIIDGSTVGQTDGLLRDMLTNDSAAEARQDLRRHYFGEGTKGTSTVMFTEAISKLIANRTSEMKKYHFESTNAEASDE